MRILDGELRKLYGNRQAWIGLFLFLMITVVMTWLDVRQTVGDENQSDVSSAYEQMEGMEPKQALVYMGLDQADESLLHMVSGGWQDWYYNGQMWPASVIRRVYALAQISEYSMKTIREAEMKTSVSIFSVKGFEKENLLKTKEVYQKLQDLYTPVENHAAAEFLLDTDMIDILSVAYGLLIFGILLGKERESGILQLYVTCKRGRAYLGCVKLGTACIWGMMAYLINMVGRYGCALAFVGDGSWSAPIQCLQGYEQSGNGISIGQYISWYTGAKLLWFCGRMAQWYLLIQMIHTLSVAILAGAGAWLVEVMLFYEISSVSPYYWIRCILPESLRRFGEMVSSYRCIDLWGHTVERLPLVWIASLVWLLITGIVAVVLFCVEAQGMLVFTHILQKRKNHFSLRHIYSKKRKMCFSSRTESTLQHESYKLLFVCGGAFVLVVTLVFQWNVRGYQLQPSYSYVQQIYKGMIDPLEGEFTDDLLEKIEAMRQLYETDEEIYGLSLQILRGDIDPECQYLSSQRDMGKRVVLFYNLPWRDYFGTSSSSNDVQDTFVLLMVMILICCGQVCIDHRHEEVAFLYVTKGGRKKLFQAKFKVAAYLYLILLFMFMFLPFVEAVTLSGSHTLKYPICSLKGFGAMTDGVAIGAYVVGLFLWRGCIGMIVIRLIYSIAESLRQYMSAVFWCFALLGFSFVGYFLKSDIIADLGILPYLNGNQLLQHDRIQIVMLLVIGLVVVFIIEWYYRQTSGYVAR